MLERRVERRLTAEGVCAHPWLAPELDDADDDDDAGGPLVAPPALAAARRAAPAPAPTLAPAPAAAAPARVAPPTPPRGGGKQRAVAEGGEAAGPRRPGVAAAEAAEAEAAEAEVETAAEAEAAEAAATRFDPRQGGGDAGLGAGDGGRWWEREEAGGALLDASYVLRHMRAGTYDMWRPEGRCTGRC